MEWTPWACAASAISIANEGSLVVMSTITAPAFAPLKVPVGPRCTDRTSLGKPTIEKITSLHPATACGDSHQLAPRPTSESARDCVRLKMLVRYPASIKLEHMLSPITPVPIQPIDVDSGVIDFIIQSFQRAIVRQVVKVHEMKIEISDPRV